MSLGEADVMGSSIDFADKTTPRLDIHLQFFK